MARRKFPTFGFILLILSSLWLINEIGTFSINLPWLPIILVIIAIGMIYNRLA